MSKTSGGDPHPYPLFGRAFTGGILRRILYRLVKRMQSNILAEHQLLLFRRFPELANSISWLDLNLQIAPVHRLEHLPHANLWIKRNDLNSQIVGGNKIRRLEFILADVVRQKKNHVITLGGTGSNHCLAVAICCKNLGLKCTLCLFEQPATEYVRQHLLLYQAFGANIIYAGDIWRSALEFYVKLKIRFPRAYFIEPGGASEIGVLGAVNAVMELKEQINQDLMPEPDMIICPTASNGGFAGLILGCSLCGLKSTVLGVRTGRSNIGPFELNTPGTVLKKLRRTYSLLRRKAASIPDLSFSPPSMIEDYFGGQYGIPTIAGTRAMEIFRENQAIQLEPVYTAKACAALLDMLQEGSLRHKTVLYWHTYHSRNFADILKNCDYRTLPPALHRFF